MLEHTSAPLIPRKHFIRRTVRFGLAGCALIAGSLGIGVVGYHLIEGLSWVDATLNASMILGGMGPVDALHTDAGKLFASGYALFSGVVFLVSVGIFLAPVIHRAFHHFHLEAEQRARGGQS
jgi:hypothetical protein